LVPLLGASEDIKITVANVEKNLLNLNKSVIKTPNNNFIDTRIDLCTMILGALIALSL